MALSGPIARDTVAERSHNLPEGATVAPAATWAPTDEPACTGSAPTIGDVGALAAS